MGNLIGYDIDYARINVNGPRNPIPESDYKYFFPITIYDAIHKTAEEGATTLTHDISSIRQQIASKQEIIQGGTAGTLMTWSNIPGEIKSTEIVSRINTEAVDRSNRKIPSEVAVGRSLDLKANLGDLNNHIADTIAHITEEERDRWNSMAAGDEVNIHMENTDIHVTIDDKNRWDSMTPLSSLESHTRNISNPHRVTAYQVGTYTRLQIDDKITELRDLISSSGSGTVVTGSGEIWKPSVSEEGVISWSLSDDSQAPTSVSIRGLNGSPGTGIANGGNPLDVLVKADTVDYETEWKSLGELIGEYLDNGGTIPGGSGGAATWAELRSKPEILQETGDSDFNLMSQGAITGELDSVKLRLDSIEDSIGSSGSEGGIYSELQEHIEDSSNPHNVTARQIGAPTIEEFNSHAQNLENPHNVTAAHLGLERVNNTSDEEKPISTLTQAAIDAVSARVTEINNALNSSSIVRDISWDESTCVLTITFGDNDHIDVELPIITIFENIFYDDDEHQLVLTLPDGSEHGIPIRSLITDYHGTESETVKVVVQRDSIEASVVSGSITGNELSENIAIPGNPTTTTQLQSDDSDKIATTKYVKEAVIDKLDSYNVDRPLSANMGRILNEEKASIEDVVGIIVETAMLNVIDNLGSTDIHSALSANMGRELYLTKAPKVHTSPSGSTFGRATVDLFGHVRASDVDPLMDGVRAIGTDDGRYARSDHRHPTDVSRAPISWPDTEHGLTRLLGEPRSEHPETGVYDDRIATTLWVHENFPPIPDADLINMIETAFDETEELEIVLE